MEVLRKAKYGRDIALRRPAELRSGSDRIRSERQRNRMAEFRGEPLAKEQLRIEQRRFARETRGKAGIGKGKAQQRDAELRNCTAKSSIATERKCQALRSSTLPNI